MTADDVDKLCDWTAGLYGGYGKGIVCGDYEVTGPANRAECQAEFELFPSTCQLTVGQAEKCTAALSTCDEKDDQAAMAECTALFECLDLTS